MAMADYDNNYNNGGATSPNYGSNYTSSEFGGNTTDLSSQPETSSLELANPIDLQKVWSDNAALIDGVQSCVHDVFTKIARTQPDAPAVCAWDGTFTYRRLDLLSSKLASHLVKMGVSDTLVPLCFDKSKWLTVAALAVMKAGAASVLLDTSVPQERLRSIVDQLSPLTILTTSNGGCDLASKITKAPALALTEAFLDDLQLPETASSHHTDPSSPLYIVFTSGSTGVPKGVIITHANFCSAIKYQQLELGFDERSRVLDFVSYAFDVAWSNIIHTLTAGGCLCIPNQTDVRSLQVAEVITQQQVNFLHITPTVARLLEPSHLPSIKKILFIGEPLRRSDAERWMPYCQVYNTYGPAECTVTSTMTAITAEESGIPTIGTAIGAITWVVDTDSGQNLLTPGSVGELWLEGPIVGAGYLNNVEKTNAAFVKDPLWLLRGALGVPGRSGTLYRTGDLVYQNSNGSLTYVGRKDTQVKIRGQRVELGDVEHNIQLVTPPEVTEVVAEVVIRVADEEPILVAFLAMSEIEDENNRQARLSEIAPGIEKRLIETLPTYMIPGVYLPMLGVPRTATGKTDRKALKEFGSRVACKKKPADLVKDLLEPQTTTEKTIKTLWAEVLGIPAVRISKLDNFLRHGGDSVAAIRLVSAARKQGISLAVSDIFAHPTLEGISSLIDTCVHGKNEEVIAPFSLLEASIDRVAACRDAAKLCSVAESEVYDILPCTALQEGLLAMTATNPDAYVSELIIELRLHVHLEHFQKAWHAVEDSASILRTRMVNLSGQGIVQVVLSRPSTWHICNSLAEYREKVKEDPIALGSSLSRLGLIQDPEQGKTYFVWTNHHALYDGWLLSHIQEAVEKAYRGAHFEPFASMSAFMGYLGRIPDQTSFWSGYFHSLTAPQFPALPHATYRPKARAAIDHRIDNVEWSEGSATATAIIRSALALVIRSLSGSTDTVFGVVVSGRQAPMTGIDRLAGPTIATIPLRIQIDQSSTIQHLVQQVQQMSLDMISSEQTGLQNIQKIDEDASRACQFQTLLIVQTPEKSTIPSNLFTTNIAQAETLFDENQAGSADTYALSLTCHVEHTFLRLRIVFDDSVVSEQYARRLAKSFEHILRQFCSLDGAEIRIQDLSAVSPQDLDTIWGWNPKLPETVDQCVHELISERARAHPDALAIDAWDGQLTYGGLDQLSTQLAHALLKIGIGGRGTIVPLCFDKSMWTTVAMLAVIKTGGACVTMDTSQPEDRLKSIVDQIGSCRVLSGSSNTALASKIAGASPFVVDEHSLAKLSLNLASETSNSALPLVKGEDLLYLVFTSGSTGRPKGAMISHANFASAVKHATDVFRFKSTSRVADFSSYAFDVTWSNFVNTLVTGGCLCVPSEHDRKNDLVGFCRRKRVNYVDLTPTVASSIDWESIQPLDTLVLGGEVVELDRIPSFDRPEAILSIYGPAECTVSATSINLKATKPRTKTIGRGFGLSTWIVDPDTNVLLPIGSTGELVLEGPLVGQGYLGDADRTAAAFIQDPEWLSNGSKTIPGRKGRLYKTGDLVRYEDDGTITFVGRKDTQVKLRGQRVELSEVEYHLRQVLPAETVSQVVAEVITLGQSKRQLLVAFVALRGSSDPEALRKMSRSLTTGLGEKLSLRVPTFMVPSVYVPLDSIPIATTGKTDRRALRQLVAKLEPETFRDSDEHKIVVQPTTELEIKLQALWASVLEIESSRISIDDRFMQLGGDSIAAMRLVSAARQEHLSMTVADVFESQLSQLALIVCQRNRPESSPIQPFSLLTVDVSVPEIQSQAAELCGVDHDQIEDVFPSTALQQGLLAMTAQRAGDYVSRIVTELRPDVSISRFQKAVEQVVKRVSILRTRIIELPQQGYMQVVLRPSSLTWNTATSIKAYQEEDIEKELDQSSMCVGAPLTRFGIISDADRYFFAWTQHHALYDGWSLSLVKTAFETAYDGREDPILSSLQPFIKYVKEQQGAPEEAFWQGQFLNFEAPQFPKLPTPSYRPKSDQKISHLAKNVSWSAQFTPTSVIRAAWATIVSWQSGTSDVVFGTVSSGRQAPVNNIERMAGPTIASVPVRIKLHENVRIVEFLEQIQQQALDMIPFEQTGLQNIRHISQDADRACQFQSLLIVQPPNSIDFSSSMVFQNDIADDDTADGTKNGDAFNTYALALICQQVSDSFRIDISFDSQVVSNQFVSRIAHQLEYVIGQLSLVTQTSRTRMCDLNMMSDHDLQTIWSWNARVPDVMNTCVHEVFAQTAQKYPEAIAVSAWDGEMTYAELNKQSNHLALRLLAVGVGPGTIVPLCFEKSLWVPVAVMAVMKTGAASVAFDTTQPKERLRNMIAQVSPLVVLTSETRQSLAAEITDLTRVVVSDATADECQYSHVDLPAVNPSSPLYIVFTSGSTGQPKGAIVSHRNFSSAIHHQQERLLFNPLSRVFDFTSYAFDVFWSNILHTLTSGGCFCIPSEDERMSDVAGSISRLRVNYAHFTPTLGRILDPSELSGLDTVVFSGEALKRSDARRWSSPGIKVLDTYGPAECTVTSTMSTVDPDHADDPPIGHALGTVTWIVRPDGQSLSPIGTMGELWLEGPLIGSGYLGDPEQTAAAFVEDPEWLLKGCLSVGVPGRHGRLYRTGDLVRYNDKDHSLQYLGRKDTQVKLRGQRIELSEVEHLVQALTDGKQVTEVVAEIITPESTQTPILAVFLTMPGIADIHRRSIDMGTMFDQTLAKSLPAFMIPSAYIGIAKSPMTATGKTDRKILRELGKLHILPALQEPEVPVHSLTEMETILRNLWVDVLNIDASSIGPDHHFVNIGGDSIKIMSLAMAIRKKWGVNIKTSALLGPESSLRDSAVLISTLLNGQSTEEAEYLHIEKEVDLLTRELSCSVPLCISCNDVIPSTSAVFLTGATGYLGTQILRYLLEERVQRVIVLVRPLKGRSGIDRIVSAARTAGWWQDSFASAIDVWCGDLAADRLGLLSAQWDTLCGVQNSYGVVDAIIHNGAAVHWSSGYARLKAANVNSTLQLLQASMQSPFLNRFVYISGGQSSSEESSSEADELTGYDQTKRVSERLVQIAAQLTSRRQGIFSTIKPGLIIGDADAGIANSDDLLWRIVVAAVKLGVRPHEGSESWLPVSDVKSLSKIVLDQTIGCSCAVDDFLDVTGGMPCESFWSSIENQLSVDLKPLELDLWIKLVKEDIAIVGEAHILWPVQHFLGRLGIDLPHEQRSTYGEVHQTVSAVRRNIANLNESGFVANGIRSERFDQTACFSRTKMH